MGRHPMVETSPLSQHNPNRDPGWGLEGPEPAIPTTQVHLARRPARQVVAPARRLRAWTGSTGSPRDWGQAGPGKAVEEGGLRGDGHEEGEGGILTAVHPHPTPPGPPSGASNIAAIQQDRTQQPGQLRGGSGDHAWRGNVMFNYECAHVLRSRTGSIRTHIKANG